MYYYKLLRTFAFLFIAYLCHQKLQAVYYAQCKYDIWRIMMLKNSDMCIVLKTALDFIEGQYFEALRPLRGFFIKNM